MPHGSKPAHRGVRRWVAAVAALALAAQLAPASVATADTEAEAAGVSGTAMDTAAAPSRDWHHRDLSAEMSTLAGSGNLVGFTVAGRDSRVYFVGRDSHLHEFAYYQGGWHHTDLTAVTGGPAAGLPIVAGFAMGGMNPRIYYQDSSSHIHELAYQGSWRDRDITAGAGAPGKQSSAMVAFQVGNADARLYYRSNGDSHINELAYYQGSWHFRDLTADTGGPVAACCDVVAFTAGAADSRVYYRDSTGNVLELAYYQGGWHLKNVTAAAGAPLAAGTLGLTGFTVGGADSRVYYQDTARHVHELSYFQGGWHHRDLNDTVDAPHDTAGGLAGYRWGGGANSRVYSANRDNGHVDEYAYSGGEWHFRDVTAAAGAPSTGANFMTAFSIGPDSRVYYVDRGHVSELSHFEPPAYKATIRLARASDNDQGYPPRNVLDSNFDTRWSAPGDGQSLILDLGAAHRVSIVRIAFFAGDTRRARFDLQVSTGLLVWSTVWSGQSSGTTKGLETFRFPEANARYVRFVGHGNTANSGNSLTEVHVYVPSQTSQRLSVDWDDRLKYTPYANGDTIPDFSRAGYGGGGVALPAVPVRRTVSPGSGDDGARIQAALDAVGTLTPDANGFRGAVLLSTGVYEVSASLTLNRSGVVLRGAAGVTIRATGTGTRDLINVAGSGSRSEVSGSRQLITDSYVPVGSRTFTVASASGLRIGDNVVLVRTPNQQWIDALGMDACSTRGTSYDTSDVSGETCIAETPWTPSSRTIHYERTITAINGNRISIDSPVVEAIQSQFGGGAVYKYTFPGRIQKVGVENLRAESAYASDTDEAHARYMISFVKVQDAWARDLTSHYFVMGTMHAGSGAKHVTVQDSASLDHKSQITGDRRYPFSLEGASHVLVMRCFAETGRHDYVTGSNTPGPNVFLDSRAEGSYSELGPHHRWATGTLFDNVVHQSNGGDERIGAYNRGNAGTGHGWSGAYQVFYNCLGDNFKVASPPYARNWVIGCRGPNRDGNGEYDAFGSPVGPWSLYLQQLKDRLGVNALRNVGY